MNNSLNQIFYGPPGTGKTYRSVEKAVAIVERLTPAALRERYPSRAALRASYERYRRAGQIEFLTFHQAYTYEDFVEGIRPQATEGQLRYQLEDGLFKRLCYQARYRQWQQAEAIAPTARQTPAVDFGKLYFDFLMWLREQLQHGSSPTFTSRQGGQVVLDAVTPQRNLRVRHPNGQRRYVVSRQRLARLYDRFPTAEAIGSLRDDIGAVLGGCNYSAYWAVFRALKAFERQFVPYHLAEQNPTDAYQDGVLPEPNYTARKSVVNGLDALPPAPDADRFVLIVDEMSRGNVAGIFGELITLLEPDKRLDAPEATRVTLPYSRESFGVPGNLYLIGTMNTADRSAEPLDAALRRRFTFVPVPPDPTLLTPAQMLTAYWQQPADADGRPTLLGLPKGLAAEPPVAYGSGTAGRFLKAHAAEPALDLSRLLAALNERLAQLADADAQIGHAYLLPVLSSPAPVATLRTIFAEQIIPLLAEMFFADPTQIVRVLGPGFNALDAEAQDAHSTNPLRANDVAKMEDNVFLSAVQRIYL